MGTLFYGSNRLEVQFDDRVLAHLQIVMTAKLRRGEGFILSWTDGVSAGSGRSMVWITPVTDLHYRFSGNRPPSINRTWLDELASLANTAPGLYVTEEGTLTPLT
ncbi:ATP-dependent DNA ligase [Microbacteriaceae bacterium 4G12]